MERSYIVHLPRSPDAISYPVPLVIALHGDGGNAERMIRMTKLNENMNRE
jgi:poly(3-hydroxybutyrate) depolymerase